MLLSAEELRKKCEEKEDEIKTTKRRHAASSKVKLRKFFAGLLFLLDIIYAINCSKYNIMYAVENVYQLYIELKIVLETMLIVLKDIFFGKPLI